MLTKVNSCSFLIILFHAVGLTGFLHPALTPLFLKLVPFHLLLMFVLLLIAHPRRNLDFWIFVATTFIAGFLIEILGVKTGLIFGQYQYGKTLGIKLLDVPLMIGINWVLLIYSTGVFLKRFGRLNNTARSLVGALILMLLDVLIEPVAIKFGYWNWAETNIPLRNYVGWYLFSFVMLRFFYSLKFEKRNLAAIIFLFVQIAFFAALNLWAL